MLSLPETTNRLLTGRSTVFNLAHEQLLSEYAGENEIFILDCAMRFNIFHLVESAGRFHINTDLLLERIYVQRAFTPAQIIEAFSRLITSDIERSIFIFAPMKQFFDPDVQLNECIHLLGRFIDMLALRPATGSRVLIAEKSHYSHSAFIPLYRRLWQASRKVYLLKGSTIRSITVNSEYYQNRRSRLYGQNSYPLLNSD